MATPLTKPVKKLAQFLQEQQEPFILDIYLLEKGYQKNNSNISNRFLKKGSRNFSRYHCSKVLKAVYNKFILTNNTRRIKRSHDSRNGTIFVTNIARNSQEIAEKDRFSPANGTNTTDSCSEKDVQQESNLLEEDDVVLPAADTSQVSQHNSVGDRVADADDKRQRRCIEDSKKIKNPVLIQEEKPAHEGKVVRHNSGTSKKITDENILSASIRNLLLHSVLEKSSCGCSTELQEIFQCKHTSQFLKSKKILQQTKQLLFDCVREVLEKHGKERRRVRSRRDFVGPELIGKIVCEKIKDWGQQSGDELNITKLLDFDFQDSAPEWSDFEAEEREIAFKIGDAILEDMQHQIVTDMELIQEEMHEIGMYFNWRAIPS